MFRLIKGLEKSSLLRFSCSLIDPQIEMFHIELIAAIISE